MITNQHREEQLSRAYIHAVAADAGLIFEPTHQDYGVDGSIRQVNIVNGRRLLGGHSLDVQLKATTNWVFSESEIVYDLEVKTYNDLVERFNEKRATPMVLALLCLPKKDSDWLDVSIQKLALHHCCYWCQVGKMKTENSATQRIKIPQSNILDQSAMVDLLEKVSKGAAL